MNMNKPTKSEIFTAYNIARAQARRAGETKRIERLNKSLGILLSGNYYAGEKAAYDANTMTCSCKDFQFRHAARRAYHGVCKHVEAERLLLAIHTRRADHLLAPSFVTIKKNA
jgi:hypothetical protein